MNWRAIESNRMDIRLESALLLAGLVALLSVMATLIFGADGLLFGPLALGVFWLVRTRVPLDWVLRAHGASPVPFDHPASVMFARLVQRADLHQKVSLFHAPSRNVNAYTIANADEAVIVLNSPVFQYFSNEEMAGILAHELSHVVNRDTQFMTTAGSLTTLVSQISFLVIVLSVISLPMAIAQGRVLAYVATVAFAFFMPSVAIILQAKLSRAREFAADLGATELLGTPDYLIRALLKLENYNRPFMLPWIRRAQNYFGTHPNTLQRVQRLESYTQR